MKVWRGWRDECWSYVATPGGQPVEHENGGILSLTVAALSRLSGLSTAWLDLTKRDRLHHRTNLPL